MGIEQHFEGHEYINEFEREWLANFEQEQVVDAKFKDLSPEEYSKPSFKLDRFHLEQLARRMGSKISTKASNATLSAKVSTFNVFEEQKNFAKEYASNMMDHASWVGSNLLFATKKAASELKWRIDEKLDPVYAFLAGVSATGIADYLIWNNVNTEGFGENALLAGGLAALTAAGVFGSKELAGKVKDDRIDAHYQFTEKDTLAYTSGLFRTFTPLIAPLVLGGMMFMNASKGINETYAQATDSQITVQNTIQIEEPNKDAQNVVEIEKIPIKPTTNLETPIVDMPNLRNEIKPLNKITIDNYDLSGTWSTGDLAGNRIGYGFEYITRIPSGTVPDSVSIDFLAELKEMWNYKIERSKDENGKSNPAVRAAARLMVENYESSDPRKMSLEDYMDEAQTSIDQVKNNIDWKKIGDMVRLNDEKLGLLKNIMTHITGEDLISYSITELAPAHAPPNMNIAAYEFILKNAGATFLESIAAGGDGLSSLGPYQVTSYTIFGVPGKERGASLINLAVDEQYQIPGSVNLLRGTDHHKAAWLHMVAGLAHSLKGMSTKNVRNLSRDWNSNSNKLYNALNSMGLDADNFLGTSDVRSNLLQFFAANNYRPADAERILENSLDGNGMQPFYEALAQTEFRSPRLKENMAKYVVKTFNNNAFLNGETSYLNVSDLLGSSFEFVRTRQDGLDVYRTRVNTGDNPTKIANNFNKHVEDYQPINHQNIVQGNGNPVSTIRPGDTVYILSQKSD